MGMISSYAKGGKVKGPGGPRDDAVKARLSDGEYVIPADVVKKVGTHALDSMVATFHTKPSSAGKKKKGYADGGLVDPSNVVSDIASEYKRGAQTSIPAAVGLAAREAVISPISRMGGAILDATKNVAGPIADAAGTFVTGNPAPISSPSAPAAAPPQPPASANPYLVDGPPGTTAPAATADNAQPAAAAPAAARGPIISYREVNRADYDPGYKAYREADDAGSVTPSLQPIPGGNVRAYLNTPGGDAGLPGWVAPTEVGGSKRLAAYAALQNAASQQVSAGSGRITALAGANLSGAKAQEAGARVGQIGAQTGEIQQNTISKRYTMQQQQNLQNMTSDLTDINDKLADPKTTPEDRATLERQRANLETQLVIMHGKSPRPAGRFKAVAGKFNPMTGTVEPTTVVDTSTGETRAVGAQPQAGASPYAEGTKLTGPGGKTYTVKNGQPVAD